MSLTVNNEGGEFEKCPIGAHAAWCISVIDLGTQHGEYAGQPVSKRKVWIMYEIPSKLMKDGRPFGVSNFYTASLHENSNLRKDLESWRGKQFTQQELEGFDLKVILSKSCLISVIHNEKGKVKINGIMPLPQDMAIMPRVNPLMSFDIDQWDQEVFEKVPEGIQKMIIASEEYQYRIAGSHPNEPAAVDESKIPF